MPEQPLSGVTVVDLTHHIAGPFCTKLLDQAQSDPRLRFLVIGRPCHDALLHFLAFCMF